MTIKIVRDECCAPVFEPYTLTLHVNNYDDHCSLKYLSMCNSKVPEALYKRANEGFRGGKYQLRADQIRSKTKAFLMELAAQIPKREDCDD